MFTQVDSRLNIIPEYAKYSSKQVCVCVYELGKYREWRINWSPYTYT